MRFLLRHLKKFMFFLEFIIHIYYHLIDLITLKTHVKFSNLIPFKIFFINKIKFFSFQKKSCRGILSLKFTVLVCNMLCLSTFGWTWMNSLDWKQEEWRWFLVSVVHLWHLLFYLLSLWLAIIWFSVNLSSSHKHKSRDILKNNLKFKKLWI